MQFEREEPKDKARFHRRRVSAEDNFHDHRYSNRHTQHFNDFLKSRNGRATEDEDVGIQCCLSDFLKVRQSAGFVHRKRLSAAGGVHVSNCLPSSSGREIPVDDNGAPIPAVIGFAVEDLSMKEVWRRAEGSAGSVGQLSPLTSSQNTSSIPSESDNLSAIMSEDTTDKGDSLFDPVRLPINKFDTSVEGVRIPLLSCGVSGRSLVASLHKALSLGNREGHAIMPGVLSLVTPIRQYALSETSVILALSESFEEPIVQQILRRLCSLEALRGEGGRQVLVGEPQIVRFASAKAAALLENSTTTADSDCPSSNAVEVPLHHDFLPDLHHTVMLRGVTVTPGVLDLRMDHLKKNGFINYIGASRHGGHMRQLLGKGRSMITRSYEDALFAHLRSLTEGCTPLHDELKMVIQDISTPVLSSVEAGQRRKQWIRAKETIEPLVNQLSTFLRNHRGCGFIESHPKQLIELLDAGAAAYGDSAKVIRDVVHRHAILDIISALSDVHWNSQASLRLRLHGETVAVGDLVCTNKSARFDVGATDILEDQVPTKADRDSPRWGHFAPELFSINSEQLKIVESPSEAVQYTLSDVLLPKLGRVPEDMQLIFPENRINLETYQKLAAKLGVEGVTRMRLGPWATYRRLAEHPIDLQYAMWNEQRTSSHGDSALIDSSLTALDIEGVRRISTIIHPPERIPRVRPGVSDKEAREELMSLIRDSASVLVSARLRRGVFLSSCLREVFALRSISAKRMFQFLNGPAHVSNASTKIPDRSKWNIKGNHRFRNPKLSSSGR